MKHSLCVHIIYLFRQHYEVGVILLMIWMGQCISSNSASQLVFCTPTWCVRQCAHLHVAMAGVKQSLEMWTVQDVWNMCSRQNCLPWVLSSVHLFLFFFRFSWEFSLLNHIPQMVSYITFQENNWLDNAIAFRYKLRFKSKKKLIVYTQRQIQAILWTKLYSVASKLGSSF